MIGKTAAEKWLNRPLAIFSFTVLILFFAPAWSSDLAKEQRWADQIVPELFDGEPVWLEADGQKFLGIHTEAASEPMGSVVVLHGIGVHPDWPQVINPLRVGLAEDGWHTLSIQLPILPNEALEEDYLPLFPEAPPRIYSAVDFLQQADPGPVFIVTHSMGASMALRFVADRPDADIAGLVLIGATGGKGGPDKSAAGLKGVKLPVLDLFGEFDLDTVLGTARARADAAKASGNQDFSQVKIPAADHFFDGYEDQLLDTVSGWLDAHR